ncbi:MAG: hypothetical protein ACR2OA_04270 [Rubripirellula sp.]|jgi:hypothetical protein
MNPNAVVMSAMKQPQNKNMFALLSAGLAGVSDILVFPTKLDKSVEAGSTNPVWMHGERLGELVGVLEAVSQYLMYLNNASSIADK